MMEEEQKSGAVDPSSGKNSSRKMTPEELKIAASQAVINNPGIYLGAGATGKSSVQTLRDLFDGNYEANDIILNDPNF